MTQALRSYLLAIVAVSLLTAILLGLLPKGGVRRAAGLTCAMALAVVVLRPVAALEGESLARAIARLEMESEQLRTGVEVKNRELVAAIIKQNAETYILDKAASMNMELRAEVTVESGSGYPYPTAVTLTGSPTLEQRQALSACIAENLAIPAERQTWKQTDIPPAS